MEDFSVEGIVLEAVRYEDDARLVTLLTKERGLIRCFAKRKRRLSIEEEAWVSPLSHGEYFLRMGKGECYRLAEALLHTQHLEIRTSLERIQTAQKFITALLRSQLCDRPSPELFTLFSLFLRILPTCTTFDSLLASFYLKIMKYEGLTFSLPCTPEEQTSLHLLTDSRSLPLISAHPLPQGALIKIETLFFSTI